MISLGPPSPSRPLLRTYQRACAPLPEPMFPCTPALPLASAPLPHRCFLPALTILSPHSPSFPPIQVFINPAFCTCLFHPPAHYSCLHVALLNLNCPCNISQSHNRCTEACAGQVKQGSVHACAGKKGQVKQGMCKHGWWPRGQLQIDKRRLCRISHSSSDLLFFGCRRK